MLTYSNVIYCVLLKKKNSKNCFSHPEEAAFSTYHTQCRVTRKRKLDQTAFWNCRACFRRIVHLRI